MKGKRRYRTGSICERRWGGRIEHEKTPTLRSNMGDNQLSVAYEEKNVRHLENQGGALNEIVTTSKQEKERSYNGRSQRL